MTSIFVFGSNLSGIHGAGAAYVAWKQHGAVWGQGEGQWGNSYAIPTKDRYIKTLALWQIDTYIKNFSIWAGQNPDFEYYLTPIGCGLAGYKRTQIKPLFLKYGVDVLPNVTWADSWNDRDVN